MCLLYLHHVSPASHSLRRVLRRTLIFPTSTWLLSPGLALQRAEPASSPCSPCLAFAAALAGRIFPPLSSVLQPGPNNQPTSQPGNQPTYESAGPANQPTNETTNRPTDQPTAQPTNPPTDRPTNQPTIQAYDWQPTNRYTNHPSGQPTGQPINWLTNQVADQSANQPTANQPMNKIIIPLSVKTMRYGFC